VDRKPVIVDFTFSAKARVQIMRVNVLRLSAGPLDARE
jgi:hypothetical protein